MPLQISVKPDIPIQTARMANSIFGPNNIYIKIGDRLYQRLQDGLNDAQRNPHNDWQWDILPVYALITAFQFVEGLSDYQALEAIQSRVDWKYALHLPMNFLNVPHSQLCQERQSILHDPICQAGFEYLLDCLEAIGFLSFGEDRTARAVQVVDTVCTLSRMEMVVKAMSLAIEALAAEYPDWLRQIVTPGWYARYGPGGITWRLPVSKIDQEALTLSVGKDSRQLIEALLALDVGALNCVAEIQILEQLWQQQFNLEQDHSIVYLSHCSYCGVRLKDRINGHGDLGH